MKKKLIYCLIKNIYYFLKINKYIINNIKNIKNSIKYKIIKIQDIFHKYYFHIYIYHYYLN